MQKGGCREGGADKGGREIWGTCREGEAYIDEHFISGVPDQARRQWWSKCREGDAARGMQKKRGKGDLGEVQKKGGAVRGRYT